MKIRFLEIDDISNDDLRAALAALLGSAAPAAAITALSPSRPLPAQPPPSLPAAQPKTPPRAVAAASLPPARDRLHRRPPTRLLVCLEKPGETFTPDQAAALAGVSRKVLMQSVTPSAIKKGHKTGGYTFRRADEASIAPAPDHEARPRPRGDLAAINPYGPAGGRS